MNDASDISRFIDAHKLSYQNALSEVRNGRKTSHWMWFVFPQISGLGKSYTSQYYAIRDIAEATAFLQDKYLCGNMLEICNALLALDTNNATEIFGRTDAMKLKSSMTLFSFVPNADRVFCDVLEKYYEGKKCNKTLKILGIL